jgi:hypothetical protein
MKPPKNQMDIIVVGQPKLKVTKKILITISSKDTIKLDIEIKRPI